MITLDLSILNQKGTPMFYSDTLALRPTFGIAGRIFIDIASPYGIYRDTGSAWVQIADSGGLSGSGTATQIAYFNTASSLASSANLFWDNTNGRLGVNTATPGTSIDAHGTGGTIIQSNSTTLGNSLLSYQLQGVGKWQTGNVYNAGSNYFRIYDQLNSIERLKIQNTGQINTLGWLTELNTLTGITGTSVSELTYNSFTNNFTFNTGITTSASVLTIGLLTDNILNYSGANTINVTSYNTSLLLRNNFTFGSAAASVTYTQATGIRALANEQNQYIQNGANSGTISHYANIQILGDNKTGAGLTTFTNRYGILINDYNEFSPGNTYTNRWGIYQAGLNESNFFAGKVGIGSGYTPGTYQLDVIGTVRISNVLTFTNASTGGTGSLYIGIGDITPFGGNRNIQIGNFSGSIYTGTRNVTLGSSTILTTASNVVQIGNNSLSNGSQAIAIGNEVTATANALAMGRFCSVSGLGSINICFDQFNAIQYTISNNYSFNIGSFTQGESSAIYQGIINAQDVYIGRPARSTSSFAISLDGSATSINGMGGIAKTDATGGNLTLNGGVGLGAGTAGDVIIGTATPGTTGTTIQTLTQRWWVKSSTGTLANVSSPNASAATQIDSTTKGFLPPRMTTTQKNAIATPAAGLVIYDSTLNKLCVYTTSWQTITSV
jgi:hypothetical protein